MAKELTKEELNQLQDEYMQLAKTIDNNSITSQLNWATITFPNYLQAIYVKGYKAGFEEGKQVKIDGVIKSN